MTAHWKALPRHGTGVAEVDGTFAGLSLTDPDDPEGPCLHSLHITAAKRGRGIGRALFDDVAGLSRSRRPPALWLIVLARNVSARSVYCRWGGAKRLDSGYTILGVTVPAQRVRWDADAPARIAERVRE